MKKITQCILGIFLIGNIGVVYADQQTNQSLEKEANTINYTIKNVQQYAHSDGYILKKNNGVENKVFAGTNHYKAQMEVVNQDKKVTINIMYSITDPLVTGSSETPDTPQRIVVGEETLNNNSNAANTYIKNTSNKELEKLQSIGVSKQQFDSEMHRHFNSVFYL